MTTLRRCAVDGCADMAIVENPLHLTRWLCLIHAADVICDCGHTAARCPIIGCGDWTPVNHWAEQLLMFEFNIIVTPTIFH